MTPHELNLHIQEFNERTQREDEEELTIAYLTAYWHRVKRMPNLKNLIEKAKPKKPLLPQTPEQQLEKAKALNAAMGGKLK